MTVAREVDVFRRRSIRLAGWDYAQTGAYFVTVCTQAGACLFGEIRDCEMHRNHAGDMLATVWDTLPQRFPQVTLDAFVVMPNHVHGILFLGPARPAAQARAPLAGARPIDIDTQPAFPVGAPLVGARVANTTAIVTERQAPVGAPLVGARVDDTTAIVAEPAFPVGAPLVGARVADTTSIVTEPGATTRVAPTRKADSTVPPLPVGAPLVGARATRITTAAPENTPIAPTLGDIVAAFKSLTTVEFIRGVKTSAWPRFDGRLWQRNYYEHIIRDDATLTRIRQYIAENPARWTEDSENRARMPSEAVRR